MEQRVTAGGMEVRWRVDGGRLFASMRAPTTGWVAVGLNSRPALAGSLLVMGAVVGGEVRVEEHIARPPEHPPRVALGGRAALHRASGREAAGETEIAFELSLDNGDGVAPALSAGQEVYLTLAFSREDDFGHHSAMRTAVRVSL